MLIYFIIFLSTTQNAKSVAEIQGVSYIDSEKPYKSYVGKIISDKYRREIGQSNNIISIKIDILDEKDAIDNNNPNGPSNVDPDPNVSNGGNPENGGGVGDKHSTTESSSFSNSPFDNHNNKPHPSDDPNRKKPTIIHYKDSDKIDPSAPGWFALKENEEFGKALKLGTLLRRKGKNESDSFEYVDDTEDENNDESEKMSPILRKYDKACLWQEYQATKAELVGPTISPSIRAKVRWQNEQLAHFFLNIVFNSPLENFGNSSSQLYDQKPFNSFKLLHLVKEIFTQQICIEHNIEETSDDVSGPAPATEEVEGSGAETEADVHHNNHHEDDDGHHHKGKILPKEFTETLYHLFLKLYELTRNKQITEYLSEEEFEWIKKNLENCNQTKPLPKKIQWFTDECKETVVAYDQENNYACTPYIEYDFNVRKYDPILDFVWHMVASVHSHCFESFQSNIRLWHRFSLAVADLITPEMRLRWSASSDDNKKLYTRFLGPDYEIYFDNVNRCMYGATLRSNISYLLPRFEGNRKTRFAPSSVQKFNFDAAETEHVVEHGQQQQQVENHNDTNSN